MKKLLLVLLLISTGIFAQKITEREYNCIYSMDNKDIIEAKPGQATDQADLVIDKLGLSSMESRKPLAYRASLFMQSEAQTFTVEKVEEGYYKIISKITGNPLTIEAGSTDENALVITEPWEGGDHQIFSIVRDIENTRIAAFIINKKSGKALAFDQSGKLVQKTHNPNDKGQAFAFAHRYSWHNGYGYIGVPRMFILPGKAVLTDKAGNACWNYIAQPGGIGVYYITNTLNQNVLMTAEAVDDGNLASQYTLMQRPYKAGTSQAMLFKMEYIEGSDNKYYLQEFRTKYVVDVDSGNNLILVPLESASEKAQWGLFHAMRGI